MVINGYRIIHISKVIVKDKKSRLIFGRLFVTQAAHGFEYARL